MGKCRIGLVGAGNVAQRHARVLTGFDDVEVVGVADVLPAAARRLTERHGGRPFTDVAELLGEDLDAVYVCVPPFAHGPAEEAVIEARLPMFVEKPLALDLDRVRQIAARVTDRQVLTAVGHHWRYLPAMDRARDLLADRPVRLVAGAWLDKVPPVPWWARRDGSGGPVIEQAAHLLDAMRLLAGEVTEVHAYGNGTPPPVPGADVDGVTAAVLRFSAGAVGTLSSSCVLGWKHRARVQVLADGLALAVGEEGLVVRDGATERCFPADAETARIAVDRAFVDAVRGIGDDIRAPYPEALETHRLACAVARSAATGQSVRLDTASAAGGSAPTPSRWAENGFDG